MDRAEAIVWLIQYVENGYCCGAFKAALETAIAALREQDVTDINVGNKWISVKEKPMPEGNEEYEVCCDYRGEKRIEIHKGWNTHGVTHWRPLPKPPKEGA